MGYEQSDTPPRLELSHEDDLIRVFADKDLPLAGCYASGNLCLGTLLESETRSFAADVYFVYTPASFVCYSEIQVPPSLTAPSAKNRFLADLHISAKKVVPLSNDSRLYAIYPETTEELFTMLEFPDTQAEPSAANNSLLRLHSVHPRVHGSTVNKNEFAFKDYEAEHVVTNLGKALAATLNVLHHHIGSDIETSIALSLPYKDNAHRAELESGRPAEVLEITAEHEGFPRFEDFAGIDRHIEKLREVITDLNIPDEVYKRYNNLRRPSGILLQGKGGSGKTQLSMAFARELGAHYTAISPDMIMGGVVGESSIKLRQAFDTANRQPGRTVLFFDEFNGLFSRNAGGNSGAAESLIATFKDISSRMEMYPNVILMAATNSLDGFDDEIIRSGRFDTIIKLERPLATGLSRMFDKMLQEHREHFALIKIDNDGVWAEEDAVNPGELARWSEGFNAADIRCILDIALRRKMRMEVSSGKPAALIGQTALEQTIKQYRLERPAQD